MHLIEINQLSREQIETIFRKTDDLIENKTEPLKNKTIVLFFSDSSIRTRLSFEKGINQLGGHSVLFPPSTLDKRENIMDVVRYIENWADAIVVRHPSFELVKEMAQYSKIPVINAMTDEYHPCEILGDLYALGKIKPDYLSLNYTFVGEKANIFNSWFAASKVLDFKLNHVGLESSVKLTDLVDETDIYLTDPLPQELRTAEYYDAYQLRMSHLKPSALVNPCPPFFRGEEVSAEIIASDFFVGYAFKKNLLYVQMAILLYCLEEKEI